MSSNTEASGRFHTDWLNMMYPRLWLARNLLRDDGFIFVSIDDSEVQHMRILLSDVFGEENFIANIIWQKKYTRSNDAQFFSDNHDHVLVFVRDKESAFLNLQPRTDDQKSAYNNPDRHPKGPWKSTPLHAKSGSSTVDYKFRNGVSWSPPKGTFRRYSDATMQEMDKGDEIWFGPDGAATPSRKSFLSEVKEGVTPVTIWPYQEVGHNHEANSELKSIMGEGCFDNPKPVRLINRIISLSASDKDDDIALDFFAGSGTTAHVVLDLNKQDSGNRRFILVQLPEPIVQKEYPTIAEITKERVRRVIKKLNDADAGQLDLNDGAKQDRGFRVFKLDASNLKPWDANPEDLNRTLLDHVDHILPDRSEDDLLFELLLKLGLELTVPMETRTIANKVVHAIGGGALLVCLTESIARTDVDPLAMGILAWRQELAPAVATTFVFRDSAFDDVGKTNLAAILEQNLPASELAGIRSL